MDLNKICSSNFNKMCRTCLTIEDDVSSENSSELFNKLHISIGIKFLQDGTLPNSFCSSCTENINIMFEFKRLCVYSQQILSNIMLSEALKVTKPVNELSQTVKVLAIENNPVSKSETVLVNTESIVEKSKQVTYKCPECPRIFSREDYLKKHLPTHIPIENRIKYCPYCNKRYIIEKTYLQHLKNHEDKNTIIPARKLCKLCGKSYSKLKSHMRLAHGEKTLYVHKNIKFKRHVYPQYGKTFNGLRDFQSQIGSHNGKKIFKSHTNRELIVKSHIQTHKNQIKNTLSRDHVTVHTSEQSLCCKVCERKFVRESALRTHMKKHSLMK